MVKEEKINDKKYFMCEACDMHYLKKDLAKECEDFCNKHHACNTEIIKHAVNPKEEGKACDIDCKKRRIAVKMKESVKTGVVAGFLGSLCCTLPILIVALGLGSIGFALGFTKYRPFFIILGIVFLTFALYRYIKKKEGCCTISTIKNNLLTIIFAIITAVIIWALLIYFIAPLIGGFVYG
jgi:hypothetical protein